MNRTHRGQHGDDCYGCKLQTIRLARGVHPISRKDRRWDKDMEAYSRLRKNGVQPPSIDGSAELESHARSEVEFTYGLAKTDDGLKRTEALVKDLAQ